MKRPAAEPTSRLEPSFSTRQSQEIQQSLEKITLCHKRAMPADVRNPIVRQRTPAVGILHFSIQVVRQREISKCIPQSQYQISTTPWVAYAPGGLVVLKWLPAPPCVAWLSKVSTSCCKNLSQIFLARLWEKYGKVVCVCVCVCVFQTFFGSSF